MRRADRPNFRSQWPGTEPGGQTERPGVASMASSERMHLLRNEYEAGLPEPADSSFERASEKTSSERRHCVRTIQPRIHPGPGSSDRRTTHPADAAGADNRNRTY